MPTLCAASGFWDNCLLLSLFKVPGSQKPALAPQTFIPSPVAQPQAIPERIVQSAQPLPLASSRMSDPTPLLRHSPSVRARSHLPVLLPGESGGSSIMQGCTSGQGIGVTDACMRAAWWQPLAAVHCACVFMPHTAPVSPCLCRGPGGPLLEPLSARAPA